MCFLVLFSAFKYGNLLRANPHRVSERRLIALHIIPPFSSLLTLTLALGCQSLLKHDAALCRLSRKSISGIHRFAIYLPV
jgi:hypothetical protein